MSPLPLSDPFATDRLNAQNFLPAEEIRSHARQIYCAAHEEAQGNGFDTFSANADLLYNGEEDLLRSFRPVAFETRLSNAAAFSVC